MQVEIRGIKFFLDDDDRRPWSRLAHAEICFKDQQIVVRDVLLSWSKVRGFRALPPLTNPHGTNSAIGWNIEGEWAKALADQIADMWERMGGKLPEVREPTAQEQTAFNAARRHAEKRKEPLEYRIVPATFQVIEPEAEADETEAVEGLHRTLSVEAAEAERVCG